VNSPSLRWRRDGRRAGHLAALAAAALTCLLAAGCGSSPSDGAARPAAPRTLPLATSFASSAGSDWAIVEMGGSAAQEENFWQLFVRSSATSQWRQATPLGVADNGGLVVASPGGASLLTGFRPSQDLTYSPLAASSNNGASWSATGPVSPGLASVPDALAAGPGGQVVALTGGGGVQLGSGSGATWKRLSSVTVMAATPAGRACGLTGLTAAAFTSSGTPVLAGSCSRAGTVGLFTSADLSGASSAGHDVTSQAWQAAGPSLPASLARDDIDVLRLAAAGSGLVALLRAGAGPQASLVAAFWQPSSSGAGGAGTWTVSAPLRIGTSDLESTTVGPGWAIGVTLSGNRGETLAGPGSAWQALPALPHWTATLALGPAGQVDAISAHTSTFSDWRLQPGSGWTLAQTVRIQIPYGSSG
jgi:hypothetical protein